MIFVISSMREKYFSKKVGENSAKRVQVRGGMGKNLFQKCAMASLVAVLLLIFVGAIVRVTGAGMGCPDWPTCWGCLIPPTKVENVDFDKLDIATFQRKAERMGRDPSTITVETLRAEFNPRHVWTEFINRLFSLPVGIFSLATLVLAFGKRQSVPVVFWSSFAALILVLVNAWMGARVVYSGLAPGVLTLHMAMAFLLIMVQVYTVWRAADQPWQVAMRSTQHRTKLRWILGVLFFTVVAEGIMGSQIREMTDEMSKHFSLPRQQWNDQLEHSWLYVSHRSFSWVIFALTAWAFLLSRKQQMGAFCLPGKIVVVIVALQMILGLIMSQVHIYGWVQVLHVGLAAILLAANLGWLLGVSGAEKR